MESVFYTYQFLIFFYSILITIFYISLAILGYINIVRTKRKYTVREENNLKNLPEIAPGISIVAPAYNEEIIIIDNVKSLMSLDYPNFEVVIINDGSKDKTLDLLIDEFDLKVIPFPYIQKVECEPVINIYRSNNEDFQRLTVVNKKNGGTKADAMNAGINVAKYDYFINTDVDCILARDTLSKVILPVLDSKVTVIGVGATMRMVNSCELEESVITRVRPPKRFVPLFQETEYLRSYLLAKMGWSMFNLIPNISGGFGLFQKKVVIDSGGFDPLSHAEDMDMTIRMAAHMMKNKQKYRIVQIPDTCCWTEGPPNVKVLNRQRSRWGRGLLQIFVVHRKFLFNPKYKKLGMFILPYALFFEFMAPIIEAFGFLFLIFLVLTNQVNYSTFWLMILFVYLIGVTVSLVAISYDIMTKKLYQTYKEYLKLILFSSFEAIIYHPLIVIFTLRGYIQFLTRKNFSWGDMTRQGFTQAKKEEDTENITPTTSTITK